MHLFAGAGGGILGGMLLGHTTVCAVEIEPYCRKVLLQRQRDGILPKFPIWDDIKTFDGKPWRGLVDVVCGGFPCQDIAVGSATKTGLDGERSGLWSEMARVVCEVRPRYVFVENSAVLTVWGIDRVLGGLAAMGYDARWGVFSAGDVGARHERKRLWMLAHSDKIQRPTRPWYFKQSGQFEDEFKLNQSMSDDYASRWVALACSFSGMDDGPADRVEQASAIGNLQVPQVAALAWETLSQ